MSVLHKIAGILLYIIFGISIVVMGFFYFGEKFIDEAAYNAKLAKIEAAAEPVYTPVQTEATEGDSVTEAAQPVPVAPPRKPAAQTVTFSFFEKLVYNKTDLALSWGYILLALTIFLALIFPLIFMFSSLKNMIRTLGLLVGIAVVIFLAYSLSSGTPLPIPGYEGTDNINPSVLKNVDTGLFVAYFLLGLALVSILYSEVVKVFK